MGNNKVIEEPDIQAHKDSATPNNKIEKSIIDSDDKEEPKYSASTSDDIEISKEDLVVPSAEQEKITK